jgi:ribonuclease J
MCKTWRFATGSQNGREIAAPEVIARGFAEPEDSLLDEARDEAQRTLAHCLSEDISELKLLQEHIHDAVGQLIRERTGRRPMILPVVLEV